MKNKIVTAEQAVECIGDGAVIMVGGFASIGTPEELIDALVKKGSKDLTIISCDAGRAGLGVGKLLRNGQVKKLIASHVGLNSEVAYRTPDQPEIYNVEYVLVPQGTLAECIRAAGCGLGGILTPVGLGTAVAEGKETVMVKGKEYLLEEPFSADFALIRGSMADQAGNVIYNMTARNFNTVMAMAAEHVILCAEEIVEIGAIDPNHVMTPALFIDSIVGGAKPCRI
ncbi:MAG: CoA transferase subunit [Bacillota bacterium]|jgi:acetate CoA/acetoacetate CoA-transferase alpha subunit|nr:CoA transferase subunit [Bacillota bacterium]